MILPIISEFGGNKMAITNCDNCVSYDYDEEYNEPYVYDESRPGLSG